ncbi:MAG: N-acetylglucosamine-6-phosphate deacetylase [Oceanotoga sp.]|jgi:N-acetylglucosamine-6-phosphate deacetylase|uniref:N-acetylglucosamine 6-phosphate deacetylase n=1 Tax=Oceanotoga teriensis TaxID=515440 RepID=A0AA45HHN2_9BACT|nr:MULTISPECIES: N-acetylglucosamine-6-phosphate deacetylase [Oceanotoga]MDN5342871.1 N-acetylglucosamine-6-phosphate deacetylase [Oceanotoga sp.]PWJ87688.1 N-acetylglucosamine 6-phosphate deacetylase [Oceanotoga teriensis]
MRIEKVLIVDPIKGEFTGDVIIENERIKEVIPVDYEKYEQILMPGFVDYHTHSLKGIDTMHAKKEDFEKWANMNFEYGVTSFFPTTVSASKTQILSVIKNLENVGESIDGLHLEGPFINEEKKGAQNPAYIRNPTIEELEEITPEMVKLISMAPERQNFKEALNYLKTKKVRVSIGHSSAGYEIYKDAFKNGVDRITHFPNALSAFHHREIGGTGSALLFDFKVEIIADGIHSVPEFIELTYKIKGADKIILITDSMEAAGLEDGQYELGGLPVTVKEGVARLKSGSIAGSTLLFDKGVRNFKKFTNCTLQDLAKVSSYNAAVDCGIKDIGRIENGYYANIVLLDKDLNVLKTIFKGKEVYNK